MLLSPALVTNAFLERAHRDGRALTGLQIQCLLYLAHGWHLGYFGKGLVDDTFEGNDKGVYPQAFQATLARRARPDICGLFPTHARPLLYEGELPAPEAALVDSVWKNYAHFSGLELQRIVTQPRTPWAQEKSRGTFVLPDSRIEAHFREQIARHAA